MSVHTKQDGRSSIAKSEKSKPKWQNQQPWEQYRHREPGGDHPRGSVWEFKNGRGPSTGIGKDSRPFLIVSEDISNERSDQVIVVALSGSVEDRREAVTVLLERAKESSEVINCDSVVLCRNIYTVKKTELHKRRGISAKISSVKMREINSCLMTVLALHTKS